MSPAPCPIPLDSPLTCPCETVVSVLFSPCRALVARGPLAQAGTVSALELALQVTHTERVSVLNRGGSRLCSSEKDLFCSEGEKSSSALHWQAIQGNNNWFNESPVCEKTSPNCQVRQKHNTHPSPELSIFVYLSWRHLQLHLQREGCSVLQGRSVSAFTGFVWSYSARVAQLTCFSD